MQKNFLSNQINSSLSQYQYNCPYHQGFKILMICQQQNCKKRRRCCVQCIDENHQGHHVSSLQKFLKQLEYNLQKSNKNPQKRQILKHLQKVKQKFTENCQKIKSQVFNQLNIIQEQFYYYVNILNDILNVSKHDIVQNHILKTFNQQKQSTQVISQYLKLSRKAKNRQFGTLNDTKKLTNLFLSQFKQKSDELISKLQQNFIPFIGLLQSMQFTGKKYMSLNLLNQKWKSQCIQISDSRDSISNIVPRGNTAYPICCLQRKIDPLNNNFYVKIQKCEARKIFFGVCHSRIVHQNGFNSAVGHNRGSYAIYQNGATKNSNLFASLFNHSSASYNHTGYYTQSSSTGWIFDQGDILRVYVNYQQQQITFYLLNQKPNQLNILQNDYYKQQFSMPIVFDQGSIYPFIGSNSIGNKDIIRVMANSQVDRLYSQFDLQSKLPFTSLLEKLDNEEGNQLFQSSDQDQQHDSFTGDSQGQENLSEQSIHQQQQYLNEQSYNSGEENLFD